MDKVLGPLSTTVRQLSGMLQGQQVALVVSSNGASRRSALYLQYLLRTQTRCASVLPLVVNEPTVSACKEALDFIKRVRPSAVLGLGGSTVMDASKFIAYQAGDLDFIAVPTIPCAGREWRGFLELYDWDSEERIVMSRESTNHHTLIDPALALEDKMDPKIDLRAFVCTLSTAFNQPDKNISSNAELLERLKGAFQIVKGDTFLQKVTSDQRADLFRPTVHISDKNLLEEVSLDVMLSNKICSSLALPRSIARCTLFHPTIKLRAAESTEVSSILQYITSTSSTDASLKEISNLLARADIPEEGLFGYLSSKFPEQNTDDGKEAFFHWADELASDHPAMAEHLKRHNVEKILTTGW